MLTDLASQVLKEYLQLIVLDIRCVNSSLRHKLLNNVVADLSGGSQFIDAEIKSLHHRFCI